MIDAQLDAIRVAILDLEHTLDAKGIGTVRPTPDSLKNTPHPHQFEQEWAGREALRACYHALRAAEEIFTGDNIESAKSDLKHCREQIWFAQAYLNHPYDKETGN